MKKKTTLSLLLALIALQSCLPGSCGEASNSNTSNVRRVGYNGNVNTNDNRSTEFQDPEFPEFPWPPKASALLSIPPPFVKNPQGPTTLRDVGNRLQHAFQQGGYAQTSYYHVPDGFALVSQLEQFKTDGSPVEEPYRWSIKGVPPKFFSLDYWKTLIKGQPGHYRVIVFVVTTHPFAQRGEKIDSEKASRLAIEGATALPKNLAEAEFTEDHSCIALVYEFEKTSAEAATEFKENSSLLGSVHLQKILPFLGKEN